MPLRAPERILYLALQKLSFLSKSKIFLNCYSSSLSFLKNGIRNTRHATKKNRLPTVRTIDPQKNPYNVENIEWCYGRRCTSDKIDIKLPPKLELLQELLMEEEFLSVTDISDCLDVSVPTTWNYICKLISQNPSMELVQKAIVLVNGSCLKICLQEELKGTLKENMMHINRMLENDEEWNKETEKYSHLRLSRMYRDILNSN